MRPIRGVLVASVALALWSGSAFAQQAASSLSTLQLSGDADSVRLVAQGTFDATQHALQSREGGRVVVLDLDGVTLADTLALEGDAPLVTRSSIRSHGQGVRLVLHLRRGVTHHVEAEGDRLVLQLRSIRSTERVVRGNAQVRGMHMEHRNGRDRLVIELDRRVEFRERHRPGASPEVLLLNASIAPDAVRSLTSGEEDNSVVRGVQLEEGRDSVVVRVARDGQQRGTPIREGRRLVWLFVNRGVRTSANRSTTVAREPGYGEIEEGQEVATNEVAAFLTDVPLQVGRSRNASRYQGRRIDLDFHNADLHNILRLLAEVGGVNIVTSDAVSGTVTIRMRNVPWDQALDVILQTKNLGQVRRGNLIRVAPLEALEEEREAAIARQKQQVNLEALETRLVPVSYATAEALHPRIEELLTERGHVSVDTRTNVLIVRDTAGTLDEIEEMVRTLDTQTPQILVETRIVQARSTYARDMGVQWGGSVIANAATGNQTGLVFPANVGVQGAAAASNFNTESTGLAPFGQSAANPNFGVNVPMGNLAGGAPTGGVGLTLGSIAGDVNINVRLSAAEINNMLRIVSAPRILTVDNEEAHIQIKQLVPFDQQTVSVGATTFQTQFQEINFELRVTPHATADGQVAMHVKIKNGEIDQTVRSQRGQNGILQREAETRLLVEDGHTAVIGGIYSHRSVRQISKVPFFGDIPILGALFQRRGQSRDRDEMLIFLTPRIVNRSEAFIAE